jgi:hypothetical protein
MILPFHASNMGGKRLRLHSLGS